MGRDPQALRQTRRRRSRRHGPGPLLFQRRRGPLPDLLRPGLRADRDAVRLRRLRALRDLRRTPLQGRGPDHRVRGQVDRRHPRARRRRSRALLRTIPEDHPGPPPAHRRGPRLPQARPAPQHPLRRRVPAPQARPLPRSRPQRPVGQSPARPGQGQPPPCPDPYRRAHHRPPPRRCQTPHRRPAKPGRCRALPHRDRAQYRPAQIGRLDRRDRPRAGRGRRPHRRPGHPRGHRRNRLRNSPLPERSSP